MLAIKHHPDVLNILSKELRSMHLLTRLMEACSLISFTDSSKSDGFPCQQGGFSLLMGWFNSLHCEKELNPCSAGTGSRLAGLTNSRGEKKPPCTKEAPARISSKKQEKVACCRGYFTLRKPWAACAQGMFGDWTGGFVSQDKNTLSQCLNTWNTRSQ